MTVSGIDLRIALACLWLAAPAAAVQRAAPRGGAPAQARIEAIPVLPQAALARGFTPKHRETDAVLPEKVSVNDSEGASENYIQLTAKAADARAAHVLIIELRGRLNRLGVRAPWEGSVGTPGGQHEAKVSFMADALANPARALREFIDDPAITRVELARAMARRVQRGLSAERASVPSPASSSDLPVDDDFMSLSRSWSKGAL